MQNTMNQGEKTKVQNTSSHEGKYLIFVLCGGEYGIQILKVREIVGLMNITPVPQTPYYLKGIINLRGKLLPVIDLRLKLGLQETDYTKEQCIIVLETMDKLAGVIVDTVSEVLDIHRQKLQPSPVLREGIKDDLFLGMAKVKNKEKLLLDIDRIIDTEEIHKVESLSSVS